MITNFEIVGPYLAALMMSLGALCIFIWGVFSAPSAGADEAAKRFYHRRWAMTEPQKKATVTARCTRTLEPRESSHSRTGGICWRPHSGADWFIPLWLLAVYAVLFIWALYYMVAYWGGLGPGRIELAIAPSRRLVTDKLRKQEMAASQDRFRSRGLKPAVPDVRTH